MPPPKKAAKKAAKKSAKHAAPNHKEAKDLRRSFEHLGRIESLQVSIDAGPQASVSSLVALAQQELNAGDAKNAADLLRAAEHFGFANLAGSHSKQLKISATLLGAIKEEYEHLTQRAAEHWDEEDERHPAVASLYKSSLQGAKRAFGAGNHREALEFARAAEALAHVVKHGPDKLTAGHLSLSLIGSRK